MIGAEGAGGWYPVDSETFTLPGGGTVIGRDAYEAEMTRRVFRRADEATSGASV